MPIGDRRSRLTIVRIALAFERPLERFPQFPRSAATNVDGEVEEAVPYIGVAVQAQIRARAHRSKARTINALETVVAATARESRTARSISRGPGGSPRPNVGRCSRRPA